MISKELRAAKQLIPLNEYFKPKQVVHRFAVSKQALKAIYATSYQNIIRVTNDKVTSKYYFQHYLQKKAFLSIKNEKQLMARKNLIQLLSCLCQLKQSNNKSQKIGKQYLEFQRFVKEILEFSVRSPLSQSQIQEILNYIFDGKHKQLKQGIRQILKFDVKSTLCKAAIQEIQQFKYAQPKQKLMHILNDVLQFDRKSILDKSRMKMIVENIFKDFQQKRTLVSELLKFDVQSLGLPNDLIKGTDPQIFTEAKKEMQAYFNEGVIIDSDIFTLERFADGKSNSNYNALNFQQNKFVFYPTYIITGQMFSIFDSFSDRTLIYGKSGESKSVSIALKVLLQNQASKYAAKNQGSAEMEALKKYINFKEKIFYWNIDPIQNFDKQTLVNYNRKIVKSICNQCFQQLDEQTKNKIIEEVEQFNDQCYSVLENSQLQSKSEIQTKEQIAGSIGRCHNLFFVITLIIKDFYSSKDIRLKVVIDQINILFSHISKANAIYFEEANRFKQNKEWLKQSGISKFLKQILYTMIGFSSYDVFYNCHSIEMQYGKTSDNLNYMTARLYNRELLGQAKIFYEEDELKYMLNVEMEGYFKFEIQRIYGPSKTKQMGWTNKVIRQYLREKTARDILVTPLQIRQFMEYFESKNKNSDGPDPKLFRLLLARWDRNTFNVLRYINFLNKLPKSHKQINIKLLLSLAVSGFSGQKEVRQKAITKVNKVQVISNLIDIKNIETKGKHSQKNSHNLIDIKEIERALDKQSFQIVKGNNITYVKAIQFSHRDIIVILQQLDQLKKQFSINQCCKWLMNEFIDSETDKEARAIMFGNYFLMNLVEGENKCLRVGDRTFNIQRKLSLQLQKDSRKNILQHLQKQAEISYEKQQEKRQAQQILTTLFIPFSEDNELLMHGDLQEISPRTISMFKQWSWKGIDFLIAQKSIKAQNKKNQTGSEPKQELLPKTNISLSFFKVATKQTIVKKKVLAALEFIYELVSKGQFSSKNFSIVNMDLFFLLENRNGKKLKININENYITKLFDGQLKKKRIDQARRLQLEEKKSFLLKIVEKGFLSVQFVPFEDQAIMPSTPLFHHILQSFNKRINQLAQIQREQKRELLR